MMNKNNTTQQNIGSLLRSPDFRSESAQVQSKALLSEVAQEIPRIKWTYIAPRLIRNITIVTFELEQIAISNPERIDEFTEVSRKLAFLWEAFSKLEEHTTKETALLNAAINYELAGYQANATCIARKINALPTTRYYPLMEMGATFLERRFVYLLGISVMLQKEPSVDGMSDSDILERIGLALSAQAFQNATLYFLQGGPLFLKKSIDLFSDAFDAFSSLGMVEEANLVRGVRNLLPVMQRRSTWNSLPDLAPDNYRWNRYIKLLARGLSQDIRKARSISDIWPSQRAALESGLLNERENKIVKMPTSAGKTRIAEIAITHILVTNSGAKCIYVAPFRALVSEVEQYFFALLNDLGYTVASATGNYESDDFEDLLFRETDLLVTTPEKLDLLLRTQPEYMSEVRLVILDEAHFLHDQRRGPKFELLLTRLRRNLSNARFLVLSAVVPQETLEDFAQWFNASNEEAILTTSWRPSVQRYARFNWTGRTGVLRYAPEEDIQGLQEFVPGVIRQETYEFTNPSTRRKNTAIFPDITNKSQIAAELAFKFAELGPVLVFCPQANLVTAVANALQERIRLARLTGQDIPSYFTDQTEDVIQLPMMTERRGEYIYTPPVPITRSGVLAQEWLGDRQITKWLRSGIGVHYGDLSDAIRNAIETDFRQKNLRVLVATNTLAQGVNLPVKTVIIHSVWRGNRDGTRNRISARDYWNIAGRAGRAGEETEGLIIHITTNDQDYSDFRLFMDARDNVEPVDSALYSSLINVVTGRLSEDVFKSQIDPDILALLVEEQGDNNAVIKHVRDTLELTLLHVQAQRRKDSEILNTARRIFSEVAQSIQRGATGASLLKVFSSTGLSYSSCTIIEKYVKSNIEDIRDLVTKNEPPEYKIRLMLQILISLPEITTTRGFSGNYDDLVSSWISGNDISVIMNEFAASPSDVEELGRFIDDLFRYRLPWGVSGFTRISCSILEIDISEVSNNLRFLPSMVKFGLPNPESCWLMSIGVSSRRVAIMMSKVFISEVDPRNYDNFLEWIGDLNTDRLQFEFGIKGILLEDIAKSIFVSDTNPFLRRYSRLEDILPIKINVRGIRYDNRALVALTANVGDSVILKRDYDNLLDRNAILVQLNDRTMGFIPRRIAQVIAPEIDTGSAFHAVVTSISKGAEPGVEITVSQP